MCTGDINQHWFSRSEGWSDSPGTSTWLPGSVSCAPVHNLTLVGENEIFEMFARKPSRGGVQEVGNVYKGVQEMSKASVGCGRWTDEKTVNLPFGVRN